MIGSLRSGGGDWGPHIPHLIGELDSLECELCLEWLEEAPPLLVVMAQKVFVRAMWQHCSGQGQRNQKVSTEEIVIRAGGK